ncbi:MAG: hypothetical protein K2Q14_01090 [Gammaproteobacteria bacterium]|nr:hypothetical protein [Gammaproteobacteria bacterium]
MLHSFDVKYHSRLIFILLFVSSSVLASQGVFVNCPTVSGFEVSATGQDFADCTYTSSIITGAANDPSACLNAFNTIIQNTTKISCKYSHQNNECVCTLKSGKALVN